MRVILSVSTPFAATSFAAWVYLVFFHGKFWSVAQATLCAPGAALARTVVAVVPARDEADVIERSITSLLAQSSDCKLHVVLVDDNSGDGTAALARRAAQNASTPGRLTVIDGTAPPRGWTGKLWAVQQGIEAARQLLPDYLLLTDADIVHGAGSVRSLVNVAEERGADLVSYMAKLHCEAVAEKLLIPAFIFFFFKLYPPKWIADVRRRTAGAAGGCILVRPEALEQAGGIQAIRSEIIDDCALAATVKRTGGQLVIGLTDLVRSARAYEARDIARMISRSAFNQLRHSTLLLVGAVAGLALIYVVPVAVLAAGTRTGVAFGAGALALMTLAFLPMVRFYRLNPLWALGLPLAAVFYAGATIHSAVSYWRGAGGSWKGRVQDPAHEARQS